MGLRVRVSLAWAALAALAVWVLAAWYMPEWASYVAPGDRWVTAALTVAFVVFSLIAHVGAHRFVAGDEEASKVTVPLYPFGDAPQAWPAAAPSKELFGALAGPGMHVVLVFVFGLIWRLDVPDPIAYAVYSATRANVLLLVINLTPAYPFDGGRIARLVIREVAGWPDWALKVPWALGISSAAGLAVWSAVLFAQQARFSEQTSLTALAVAAVMLIALLSHRPAQAALPAAKSGGILGLLASAVIIAALFVPPLFRVPVNDGLVLPGGVLDVGEFVNVDEAHLADPPGRSRGAFLMTTVYDRAPVDVGAWVRAKRDPALDLIPAEWVYPEGVDHGESVEEGREEFHLSADAATVAALRLAGFEVTITRVALAVTEVVPGSPADGVLQVVDEILEVNGAPTTDAESGLLDLSGAAEARLRIRRDGVEQEVVTAVVPADGDTSAYIGLRVRSVGVRTDLPFTVEVSDNGVIGPSGGLMLALRVYDMVTVGDLTSRDTIAGTGTIGLDGSIGPIGGVWQKVFSASYAGADVFLCPPEDCAAARAAEEWTGWPIEVVEAATLESAVRWLEGR